MDYIDNAYDSLKRYFTALEYTGSYDKRQTLDLLMYCFIVDKMFDGMLSEYLDNEGLASLNKALSCIYNRNGCLINKVYSTKLSRPRGYRMQQILRVNEDSGLHLTEDNETRRTE